MVLTVSDAVLIAILLAAFALAIGLVQVLGRLIDSGGRDGWDDEPPDTKIRTRPAAALLEPAILRHALVRAFVKLDPRRRRRPRSRPRRRRG